MRGTDLCARGSRIGIETIHDPLISTPFVAAELPELKIDRAKIGAPKFRLPNATCKKVVFVFAPERQVPCLTSLTIAPAPYGVELRLVRSLDRVRGNYDGRFSENRRQVSKATDEVAGFDVVVHVRAIEKRGERIDDDEGEFAQTRASFFELGENALWRRLDS